MNPRSKYDTALPSKAALASPDHQLMMTRRKLLAGSIAIPAAAAIGLQMHDAKADGHAAEGHPNATKHTLTLGDFEVSTLLAGGRTFDEPQGTFGMNVSADEFAAVSDANFIPVDTARTYFTPTVVKAGDDIVLFDTGLSSASISGPLANAGITPEQVTIVVITHMHGDHIGGLTTEDGSVTFPNARYITGQVEFDAWNTQDNDNFKSKVMPLAEKMTFIGDGESVVSGITSMAAFGHTPGHMTYMLESGGKQLALMADLANHYVWSLAYPDWEVRFDMDKAKAAASRKKMLDMFTADKVPFVGYHMPFPALGYSEARGEGGYRYIPVSYQLAL